MEAELRASLPRRPVGTRRLVGLLLLLAGAASLAALGVGPMELVPGQAGLRVARQFFSAALTPALTHQAGDLPPGAPPFLLTLAAALVRTVAFAAAAMGLALPVGLLLGVLASSTWWTGRSRGRLLVQAPVRVLIAVQRSVHEFLWAVLFLAAVGLNTPAGVLAIAIPFAGTLAKVFSEMLDEAPRSSAHALRSLGAGPGRVFLFGQLPRALPDMAAYAFYRFECAVRSSAVLGFFGYPTLGYQLVNSFDSLHFREVWSYLYALGLLVLALEGWSARLRRRFVA